MMFVSSVVNRWTYSVASIRISPSRLHKGVNKKP